jgi:hypothetical protein
MTNRWGIFFGVVITLLLIRLDYKTELLSDRIDTIEDVIIKTKHRLDYTNHDVECLAKNIYYEAGNQSDLGKYAVATVTLNRLKTEYWGKSVCKVVYARAQFSWTLRKKLQKPNPELYNRSREIAVASLKGERVKSLQRSLLYHADYIKDPHWADPQERITKIGAHIFYKRGKNSTLEII